MSNEEILKQFDSHDEFLSYYHKHYILQAMEAARKDEAEKVAELVEVCKNIEQEGYDVFDNCHQLAKRWLNEICIALNNYNQKT